MLLQIMHQRRKMVSNILLQKISCQQSHVKKTHKRVEKFWKISSVLNKEDIMKIHILNEEKMDMTLAHE
jgi:predicted lipase